VYLKKLHIKSFLVLTVITLFSCNYTVPDVTKIDPNIAEKDLMIEAINTGVLSDSKGGVISNHEKKI
jgi:hypothetical protein